MSSPKEFLFDRYFHLCYGIMETKGYDSTGMEIICMGRTADEKQF